VFIKPAVLLGTAFFVSSSIHAQPYTQCTATLDGLSRQLADQYQEQRTGLGVTNGNAVMQLFTSAGGSWTLVLTLPGGLSCIAGAGENWQRLKSPKQNSEGTGS